MKAKTFSAIICSSALAISLGLMACGGGGQSSATSAETSTVEVTDVEDTEKTEVEKKEDKKVAGQYLDVSNADFGSVDVVVPNGDYDAMSKLVADIDAQKADDKIVQIEGIIASDGSKHLVFVPKSSGDEGVGAEIEVIGLDNYPPASTRVHLVGVVRTNDDGRRVIVVPSEQFAEVKEGDTVVKLSDASVVVPKDWTITKDDSPTQLIIKKGAAGIEFWCGSKRANEVLKDKKDLWEWRLGNKVFKGYSKSDVIHDMVNGTLVISGSDIYLSDLKDFLEDNLVI